MLAITEANVSKLDAGTWPFGLASRLSQAHSVSDALGAARRFSPQIKFPQQLFEPLWQRFVLVASVQLSEFLGNCFPHRRS
jgi:hypothetical protein